MFANENRFYHVDHYVDVEQKQITVFIISILKLTSEFVWDNAVLSALQLFKLVKYKNVI